MSVYFWCMGTYCIIQIIRNRIHTAWPHSWKKNKTSSSCSGTDAVKMHLTGCWYQFYTLLKARASKPANTRDFVSIKASRWGSFCFCQSPSCTVQANHFLNSSSLLFFTTLPTLCSPSSSSWRFCWLTSWYCSAAKATNPKMQETMFVSVFIHIYILVIYVVLYKKLNTLQTTWFICHCDRFIVTYFHLLFFPSLFSRSSVVWQLPRPELWLSRRQPLA